MDTEVIGDGAGDERSGRLMVYQWREEQLFFFVEMMARAPEVEVDKVICAVTQDVRVALATRFLESASLSEGVMVVMRERDQRTVPACHMAS
jgi:hypothetical protein